MKKRKLTAEMLVLSLCLCACGASTKDGAQESAKEDAQEKTTIGVLAYDPDDPETMAFHSYFEDYLEEAFDVEFFYSQAVATEEEEAAFIEDLHERGADGLIGAMSESSMELCEEYGIYYIFGSSNISDELFEKTKDYEYFLGTISPSLEAEEEAGRSMAEYFADGDEEKQESFLILSGGAALDNEMHYQRAKGMLETLAEEYGITVSADEVLKSGETVTLESGTGVKVVVIPGYPGVTPLAESVEECLADGSIHTVMSVLAVHAVMDGIRSVEEENDVDIRVGSVDCFTEETKALFDGTDNGGVQELDYLAGKYGAIVAPAFAALMNACYGDADAFREDGHAFRLSQNYWVATSRESFDEQYDSVIDIYENTYSADEIQKVILKYTPEADFESFRAFAER